MIMDTASGPKGKFAGLLRRLSYGRRVKSACFGSLCDDGALSPYECMLALSAIKVAKAGKSKNDHDGRLVFANVIEIPKEEGGGKLYFKLTVMKGIKPTVSVCVQAKGAQDEKRRQVLSFPTREARKIGIWIAEGGWTDTMCKEASRLDCQRSKKEWAQSFFKIFAHS